MPESTLRPENCSRDGYRMQGLRCGIATEPHPRAFCCGCRFPGRAGGFQSSSAVARWRSAPACGGSGRSRRRRRQDCRVSACPNSPTIPAIRLRVRGCRSRARRRGRPHRPPWAGAAAFRHPRAGGARPICLAVEEHHHVASLIEDEAIVGQMIVLGDLFHMLPETLDRALRTRFLEQCFDRNLPVACRPQCLRASS